jgi:hypothetical protein
MVLIIFFFANLIVGSILVLHIVLNKPTLAPSTPPATTATTSSLH